MKRWFAKGPKIPKLPKYTAVVVGHEAPKPTKVVSGALANFRLEVPANTTLEVSQAAFTNVLQHHHDGQRDLLVERDFLVQPPSS